MCFNLGCPFFLASWKRAQRTGNTLYFFGELVSSPPHWVCWTIREGSWCSHEQGGLKLRRKCILEQPVCVGRDQLSACSAPYGRITPQKTWWSVCPLHVVWHPHTTLCTALIDAHVLLPANVFTSSSVFWVLGWPLTLRRVLYMYFCWLSNKHCSSLYFPLFRGCHGQNISYLLLVLFVALSYPLK